MKKVHLIFKTHLDLGFTGPAEGVLRRYLEEFIPNALKLAAKSRREGGSRFVWTTGSWLIFQFLEHADRALMEQAIEAGDIHWHALPFTTHTELADASLFRLGLSLSQELDRRFGRKTVAAKMTDVPGHTRAVIPLLAEAGVRFLHIGVNPASTPPKVPPLARWREPGGAEIVLMYDRNYGDVVVLPDGETAVAISFTGDNLGPPTIEHVHEVYRALETQFPGAVIEASTLDRVAAEALKLSDSLPVIEGEIGDTWIHGAGTDPTKIRRFRELARLRREWLENGSLEPNSKLDRAFGLPLLTVAEHTWGLDEKTFLGDNEAYTPKAFELLRGQERCRRFESSWEEQRAYIDRAVQALGPSEMAAQANERLQTSEPSEPDLRGYQCVPDPAAQFETKHFSLAFGQDGSIASLRERGTGRVWASRSQRLASFSYQTFSAQDYERFARQYITHRYDWAIQDFTKPGMEKAGARSGFWQPKLTALYRLRDSFVLEALLPEAPHGCPRRIVTTLRAPEDAPALEIDIQWFDKEASRLPEAIWLGFAPPGTCSRGWMLDKMGRAVSPLDVVPDGNRKLHAIERYVRYRDERRTFCIESLDAPLVAPGEPSLLDFNNRLPPLRRGVHFNLYNNVWGTNFPMWCSEDARFRFRLAFGKSSFGEGE